MTIFLLAFGLYLWQIKIINDDNLDMHFRVDLFTHDEIVHKEKINLIIYGVAMLLFLICTIVAYFKTKFLRYTYLIFLFAIELNIGFFPIKRYEYLAGQSLFYCIFLYYSVTKICEDCILSNIAFFVSQFILGVLYKLVDLSNSSTCGYIHQ